jgi:LacI family transcriptional regulator
MPRQPAVRPRSAVRLKDIARRLGISVGTVDRALHGKPDISPATRARVLAVAETLGYRPNLAARYLQSGRPARISIHLPDCGSLFWQTLRDGICEAAAPFAPALGLEFRTHTGRWDPRVAAQRAMDRDTAGLIIAAGESAAVTLPPEGSKSRHIPIACVANDCANDARIASVSVDPFSVGALAGELIGRFVPGGGQVALVTRAVATPAHAEQVRGFAASLSTVSVRLKVSAVVESPVDERETHRRVLEMLRAHPRVKGLYVGTRESLPVLEAARQEGRLAGLAVITTDLSPELFDWIQRGAVAATIYQRPLTQGHAAFHVLYQHLQTGKLPKPHRQVIAPYAVMSSNLPLVLQRLDMARAAALSYEHRAAVPGL